MNDKPKQPEPVADLLNGAHQRLEDMFKKHFWGATRLALLGMALFVVAYGVIVFAFREPANTSLVSELKKSNEELVRLTEASLNAVASSNAPVATDALTAVAAQAELHKKAIEELQAKEKETPKEASTFLQLLGGSVILALLGYLGLQRLQSIDVEMQGLREFMFKQISERAVEQRSVMESQVRGEVAKLFSETKAELEAIKQASVALGKDAEQRFSKQAEEATDRVTKVQGKVTELVGKYAWLEDASLKSAAEDLSRIVSVEQAHAKAVTFTASGDANMARMALRQIIDRKLTGEADEFHNAHTHAFRLDDPQLALEISELGLSSFPDQYDLMADKARALVSTGRRDDAKTLLEDWMARKPGEFARSWRPFTFYAGIVDSCELTEDALKKLEAAFQRVTKQLPHEDAPWGKYARFLAARGQLDEAAAMSEKGLESNPFSQHLLCVLSEIRMKQGRPKESVECLERALRADYQDQFQSSVTLEALIGWLAQAYEASGEAGKAKGLYDLILKIKPGGHLEEYARKRVLAIIVSAGISQPGDAGTNVGGSPHHSEDATDTNQPKGV
jgi:tetratricopeptide (TPR) repeat protein